MDKDDDMAVHLQDAILRLFQVVIPISAGHHYVALKDIGIVIARLANVQNILLARHNAAVVRDTVELKDLLEEETK